MLQGLALADLSPGAEPHKAHVPHKADASVGPGAVAMAGEGSRGVPAAREAASPGCAPAHAAGTPAVMGCSSHPCLILESDVWSYCSSD